MANLPKLCVICGEDCAGQPRTKDAQGRYYHNECYERAREVQEGRAGPVDPEAPAAGVEPGPMNLLDEIVDDALGDVDVQNTCASCGHPLAAGDVICMSCGFNAQSGETAHLEVKKQKRAKASAGGGGGDGLAARLLTPFGVNLMAFMVLGLLLVILFATQSLVALAAFILFLSLYLLVGLLVVIVVAFTESFVQGLLTLCVPFYIIYFVFFVTDNQWAKWFFVGALILRIAAELA